MILLFCIEKYCAFSAAPFSSSFTPALPSSPITNFPTSSVPVIHHSTEKSSSDHLLVSVEENNSTSMTGSNPEFPYYTIVGSVVGLVIITCGIILMVAIAVFFHRYRRNLKGKYQQRTGKFFALLCS